MIFPTYESGMYILTPRIYQSNRENVLGLEITKDVVSAKVDSDIDRAGPKSRISITTTRPEAIPANSWIAPFLDVTPETHPATATQMGLYELDQPTITYGGLGGSKADNDGADIVALLARTTMSQPQLLPKNISMMGEVRRCIEMGTLQKVGANFFPYTYLRPTVDWGTVRGSDSSGFIGSDALSTSEGNRPRGDHSWVVTFNPGSPAGGYRYLNSTVAGERFVIPEGVTRIYITHYAWVNSSNVTSRVSPRFYAADGGDLGYVYGTQWAPEYLTTWLPHLEMFDIPSGATTMGVLPQLTTPATVGATITAYMGGIEIGEVAGVPVTRLDLPEAPGTSPSTPIAHRAGLTWLTRINDILSAMGYYALSSTSDGRLTSSQIRSVKTDAPTRTYRVGQDLRLVGDIETTKSSGNVYNIVSAVKEDIQAGTVLYAEARNDDPEHPWSTVNRGPIARELIVADAVDLAALQILATQALERASMQESLRIGILPDPTLSVYDIVRLIDTGGTAAGVWAIESITWGLTSNDPLVRIGARRATTTKEAPNDT